MITCTWMMIALCFWVDCHVSCLKDTAHNGELATKAFAESGKAQTDSTWPSDLNLPSLSHHPITHRTIHQTQLTLIPSSFSPLSTQCTSSCIQNCTAFVWSNVPPVRSKSNSQPTSLYKASQHLQLGWWERAHHYQKKPTPLPETNMMSQPPKDIRTACDIENKRWDD